MIDSVVIIGIAFWLPDKIKTAEFLTVAASNYSFKLISGLAAVLRPRAVEAAMAHSDGRGFDVVLICADTASNDPWTLPPRSPATGHA